MKGIIKAGIISSVLAFTATANAGDIVIATGSEGGGYEYIGRNIGVNIITQARKKKLAGLGVEVINTTGSKENLELFSDGEAQVVLTQADALAVYPPTRPYKFKESHVEYVYWFANKKNKLYDLEDIEGAKDVLMVLVDGSGAQVTMENFVKEDSGYKINLDTSILADDLEDAMDIVAAGVYEGKKVAGLLHVTKKGGFSSELAKDFKKHIVVGSATDGDFNDSKVGDIDLYHSCEIENDGLRGFSSSNRFSDNETICMKALVLYSKDDFDKKVYKVVRKGITKALR